MTQGPAISSSRRELFNAFQRVLSAIDTAEVLPVRGLFSKAKLRWSAHHEVSN
jgi:hypothetical protein